jgi:hypothetical protein
MADKPTVIEAISAAMADVQAVGKGDRNNEQGYSFRGIDAVVNAVGPVFRKHGIVPAPVLQQASYRDVLTSRGKPSRECTVQVRYWFYGPAGDHIEVLVPGESMDFGDKGAPKAMSVAYRIALLQLLCIPTHEPEPDAQSYERDNEQPGWEQATPARTQTDVVTRGLERITAAPDLAGLTVLRTKVEELTTRGAINAEDSAVLGAALAAREVELKAQEAN